MSYQRYVERRGANHGLHVFLTLITCGIWAITGWPLAAIIGRRTVTKVPVFQPPQYMPPQQPYGYQQPPAQPYPPQQYGPPPGPYSAPPQPGPYTAPPGPYGQQPPPQQPHPRQTSWGQQ